MTYPPSRGNFYLASERFLLASPMTESKAEFLRDRWQQPVDAVACEHPYLQLETRDGLDLTWPVSQPLLRTAPESIIESLLRLPLGFLLVRLFMVRSRYFTFLSRATCGEEDYGQDFDD